ncbi:MAG: chaperone NapD [Rhodocyclaceae bacterium]|nr:chaperone NapD [Rhodocyclaceae bacterium]MDZ4213244.1 chaperone NapD [Rhodocyclaceae bacterium]
MNISSVIVIPGPDRAQSVVASLNALHCVEVAAVSPEGKIIALLETEDDRETIQLYEQISLMDGVMSASMVYHHKETEPEAEILLAA